MGDKPNGAHDQNWSTSTQMLNLSKKYGMENQATTVRDSGNHNPDGGGSKVKYL